MKRRARSGEAQAAQHRPPVVMHHRLKPRGGARRAEYEEEVEPKHVDFSFSLDADAAELLLDVLRQEEEHVLEDARMYQRGDEKTWLRSHAALIARIRETIAAGSKTVP